MNRYIVYGGLGYLGSEIAFNLRESGSEVIVVDPNYMRSTIHIMHMQIIDSTLEEYVNNAEDLGNDIHIICSDVDVPIYYSSGMFDRAIAEYHMAIEKIVSSGAMVYHFHGGNREVINAERYKAINVPCLYGDNHVRFRSDTMINNIIRDLFFSRSYSLHGDIFEICEFNSLSRYTNELIAQIKNNKEILIEPLGMLPLVVLANMINIAFGEGYAINISPENVRRGKIDKREMFLNIKVADFTTSINSMKSSLEQGFFNQRAHLVECNNEEMINALMLTAKRGHNLFR